MTALEHPEYPPPSYQPAVEMIPPSASSVQPARPAPEPPVPRPYSCANPVAQFFSRCLATTVLLQLPIILPLLIAHIVATAVTLAKRSCPSLTSLYYQQGFIISVLSAFALFLLEVIELKRVTKVVLVGIWAGVMNLTLIWLLERCK